MHKGLVIASALLAASCDASPEQPVDQTGEVAAATANDATDGTDLADVAPNQAVTSSSFAMLAAASDLFEIATGTLAMENGQSAETREFAKMMVDDHTASLRDLMVAVEKSDVEVLLPTRLDAQQQGLLDRLAQANTTDFDSLYMSQQFDGHRTALKLHQEYQAASDDEDLRAFSQKVLPVIQGHYNQLEKNRAAQNRAATAPAR